MIATVRKFISGSDAEALSKIDAKLSQLRSAYRTLTLAQYGMHPDEYAIRSERIDADAEALRRERDRIQQRPTAGTAGKE